MAVTSLSRPSLTNRERARRKAFPTARVHLFPSTATKTEWTRRDSSSLPERVEDISPISTTRWVPVTLEEQLFRWIRTTAFRVLNAGFSFPPRDNAEEWEEDYTVEEISLGLHLLDLAMEEADLPAVVRRDFSTPSPADWDPLLLDGVIQATHELAPAVHRSGIQLVDETTNRKDEANGRFSYEQLVYRCLRVARYVIEMHDPEFIARLSAAGKKGGSVRMFTVDMIEGLKPGVRTNPWRLARELGCSEQVARKLIKEDEARA